MAKSLWALPPSFFYSAPPSLAAGERMVIKTQTRLKTKSRDKSTTTQAYAVNCGTLHGDLGLRTRSPQLSKTPPKYLFYVELIAGPLLSKFVLH